MKLYFVRHGESEAAKEKLSQNSGSPLSDLGRQQAKLVSKRLKLIPLDLIYSSPYQRARETAGIINKRLKLPLELMDHVREVKRATGIEGLSLESDLPTKIRVMAMENRDNPDWKYKDSESIREIWERAGMVMDHLLKSHREQNVLVVSHGIFIKTFLTMAIFGSELDTRIFHRVQDKFRVRNTSISLLEYDQMTGWNLVLWNDVAHVEFLE